MRNRTKIMIVAALLIAAYLASYVWISRSGYAEADEFRFKGFYYFSPVNSDAWRCKNYGCTVLYWPLNVMDRSFGLGRHPASEPMWGLSGGPKR